MAFVKPAGYSKAALDRAGNRIRDGESTADDIAMLENWRAAHLYVINTFQSSLRYRKRRAEVEVNIAQRLKRQPTIIDKLTREPGMSLSRMHDIAGCRLIFPDDSGLHDFREGVLDSRAHHELVGDKYRYDYILSPKPSGYRGIHDVYKYDVGSVSGQPWNGLRIELQYRTIVQHAWATAVEISDIVNRSRLKFSEANREITRLFLLASEILARAHEKMPGFCESAQDKNIVDEFESLEGRIHAVSRLRGLTSSTFTNFARSSKLFILVNITHGPKAGEFFSEGFPDNNSAVTRYLELERQLGDTADVVLVGSGEQDAIKLAYTNYFSDASIFLDLLDEAISILKKR